MAVLLQAVQEGWSCFVSCRIGHTCITHSYTIKKYPPPQCEHCQCILTVRHILVECNRLAQTRNGRCGVVESLQFHPELVLICFNDILIFIQNFNSIKLIFYLLHRSLHWIFYYFLIFNYITISCDYLFLTPNSRSFSCWGVVKHSFIHSSMDSSCGFWNYTFLQNFCITTTFRLNLASRMEQVCVLSASFVSGWPGWTMSMGPRGSCYACGKPRAVLTNGPNGYLPRGPTRIGTRQT